MPGAPRCVLRPSAPPHLVRPASSWAAGAVQRCSGGASRRPRGVINGRRLGGCREGGRKGGTAAVFSKQQEKGSAKSNREAEAAITQEAVPSLVGSAPRVPAQASQLLGFKGSRGPFSALPAGLGGRHLLRLLGLRPAGAPEWLCPLPTRCQSQPLPRRGPVPRGPFAPGWNTELDVRVSAENQWPPGALDTGDRGSRPRRAPPRVTSVTKWDDSHAPTAHVLCKR